MGLFDLFSNDTAEEAAAQRNAGLQKGYDALSSSYGQGRDALTTGANTASGLWGNLSSSWGGQANPYAGGAAAYGDASGANGAEGLRKATENFKNSGQYGAYGFSLDQGLQGLSRAHAAAGNLSSGNADTDSMKYASGLAGQQYNNYLQGLNPYLGLQAQDRGQQRQLETTATAGQAGAATGLASGLAGLFQNQGNAGNANYTGQGASDAAATMNNYNIGSNQLGLITGAAQLAMGMPPTGFSSIGGGGGGGSSGGGSPGLFSSFGGGGGGGSPSPLSHGMSEYFGNGTGYATNPWSSGGQFGAGGSGWFG